MLDAAPGSLVAFGLSVLRLSIWLVLLAAVFVPIERLFALNPQKVFRRDIGADLLYYFMSSLIPGFVLGVPFAYVAILAHHYMPYPVQAFVAGLPLWARLVAGMLLGELGAYWSHRLSHEIPFLWRFHSVHHVPEHMDWLVNTRTHPVDMVFTRLCTLLPLYILGLGGPGETGGSLVPVLVLIVGTVWGFFIHANVRWRFGPLEHLVATPAFHHWHHTLSGPINRNYSSMLPWLDRLFGTLHLPRGAWPEEYGVTAPERPAVGAEDAEVRKSSSVGDRVGA